MQLALYSAVHISFLKGQLLKESTFLELLCGLEMRKREEYHHLSSEDMLAFASPCCSVHTTSTCHTLVRELQVVLNYFPFLSSLYCFGALFVSLGNLVIYWGNVLFAGVLLTILDFLFLYISNFLLKSGQISGFWNSFWQWINWNKVWTWA